MTKKCLLIVICIVCALVFGLGECDTIYADTVRSTGVNEYTTTYAVPEGGWSTITFRVQLSEQFTYNYSSKKNVSKRHEKLYLWKTAYATTRPSFVIGNISHKDANGDTLVTFTSYQQQAIIYGTEWDGAGDYYNTTARIYDLATTNYSYLPFYTTCDGGMFTGGTEGSTFHSLTLNLK